MLANSDKAQPCTPAGPVFEVLAMLPFAQYNIASGTPSICHDFGQKHRIVEPLPSLTCRQELKLHTQVPPPLL